MRLVAFDGGGVRGVVAATIVRELERELHAPLHSRVELLAGTSIGSIVACAIACEMDGLEILRRLLKFAPDVFRDAVGRRFRQLFRLGVSSPKYNAEHLAHALIDVFGDLRLGDLRRPVVVSTYDTVAHEFLALSSRVDPDVFVWEACKASSSASGFFGPHATQIRGEERSLIDGGFGANTPSVLGIVEALSLGRSLEDLLCVSIGTGDDGEPIRATQLREWGFLELVPRLATLFMGATTAAMESIADGLLGARHYRLQIKLDAPQMTMDDPRPEHLERLVHAAAWEARHRLPELRAAAAAMLGGGPH